MSGLGEDHEQISESLLQRDSGRCPQWQLIYRIFNCWVKVLYTERRWSGTSSLMIAVSPQAPWLLKMERAVLLLIIRYFKYLTGLLFRITNFTNCPGHPPLAAMIQGANPSRM